MSEASEEPNVHRILGTVPYEHGFHFNVEKKYTGITAKSLADLASILETIDVASFSITTHAATFRNGSKTR